MITYKQWILLPKKEGSYIVVDYTDPEGNQYSEPLSFHTFDEALSFGRISIDQLIQAKCKQLNQATS